ncbi:hypothetical protein C8R43DRAFT_1114578 [Mycena crocata]|nr:hypothetical protein C8R43DRAFT_1114578 [Mycena crocata]
MQNPNDSRKRPFQDITDRFISTPPTARPKRKPKTPGGALGEKLRLRVKESTKSTANAFPSSLPPSSPPLYSSSSRGVPLLSSEDEVAQEMQQEETYGRYELGIMQPSDEDFDEDAENRAPANNSDPFGFFAVERKLKAKRDALPLQPAALRASRLTDDRERDDGRVMPLTPHKPKVGKRTLSANADPSLPSSPSPVKGADTDDGAPKSKKARASVPPRRSTRAQNKPPVKEKKKRVRKAPAKTKAVKDNDSDEDDPQEKFDAERQARLEYYKQLDEYSFEKETVYVV